jgi:hypothetical protein
MEDTTLTRLFARMDAHLERQDAHLERQDAHLAAITATLQHQNGMLLQMAETLADTSRFLAQTAVEQRAAMAAMTQLLVQTAERLARAPGREGEAG